MSSVNSRFGIPAAAIVILLLYALDQYTKLLVIRAIPYEGDRPVIIIPGFFALVHWGNTGAAFSSFSHNNAIFILLSVLTLLALLFFAARGTFKNTATRLAVSLLTAGVLGNVTDRIRLHHVTNFLLFDLHIHFADPWPAFNVADSCICIAAALLVISAWLEEKNAKKPDGPD